MCPLAQLCRQWCLNNGFVAAQCVLSMFLYLSVLRSATSAQHCWRANYEIKMVSIVLYTDGYSRLAFNSKRRRCPPNPALDASTWKSILRTKRLVLYPPHSISALDFDSHFIMDVFTSFSTLLLDPAHPTSSDTAFEGDVLVAYASDALSADEEEAMVDYERVTNTWRGYCVIA
ncbi:hypothetical protein HGRIS_007138 [Hohenbuehelia grisea]|uniref:Uncharacterized protein n=1 Tax=Hohenbuehelia grisea TaxID=104357 RepID=A0ABR3JB56_9AGAR